MIKVSIKECREYVDAKKSIEDALLCIGGMANYVKPGDKVLLKPNICAPIVKSKAATVHPLFLKAVIEMVMGAGGIPYVGELAAGESKGETSKAFKVSGVKNICEVKNVQLVNFEESGFSAKQINGLILGDVRYAKDAMYADVIINLPKLKSHGLTFLTGAVKNMFGCVHPKIRKELHKLSLTDFSHGIIDVYSGLKPTINIMDAIVSMQGSGGPLNGKTHNTGYVLASSDGFALDIIASKIVNHNIHSVPINRLAERRGLVDPLNIEVVGNDLKVREDFEISKLFINRRGMVPRINEKCTKCGACEDACPVGAISDFKVDSEKCIKCLCCYEVCSKGAIDLIESKHSYLRIQKTCNHECLFCNVAGELGNNLSTEKVESIIGNLVEAGTTELSITGGEPTLRKDLCHLIDFAKNKGIKKVDVQTNGVLLDDMNLVKELSEAGLDSVLVALHSYDETTSNYLTKRRTFKSTVNGIKNIIDSGISLALSFVINTQNYTELTEYVRKFSCLSNDITFYFALIRPYGRALKNKFLVPSLMDIEPYLYEMMEYCEKNGIKFMIEGIPLCYMIGYEKYNAELQRSDSSPCLYFDHKGKRLKDMHRYINNNLKSKPLFCTKCSMHDKCPGVWREYAQMKGLDELFLVYHKI